jgi:hypothetical protein
MAEKLISPGVFTQENDLSFVPQGIGEIGGAIVGPTVKGPALVPTRVTSYPEYVQLFGNTFVSGSTSTEYLTSISAKEYLKHSGALTVVRILGTGYTNATASVTPSGSSVGDAYATGQWTVATYAIGDEYQFTSPTGVVTTFVSHDASTGDSTDGSTDYFLAGGSAIAQATALKNAISSNARVDLLVTADSANLNVSGSVMGTAYNGWTLSSSVHTAPSSYIGRFITTGGSDTAAAGTTPFKLNTHADGLTANSVGGETTNNILLSGSSDNIRYEISNVSEKKGTFTLLIRRGDDTSKRKAILETWSGLSLDPNSNNFISKAIGDQYNTLALDATTGGEYLQPTGNFPNKSKYVYVSDVNEIPNYLDANGNTASVNLKNLPKASSGSFGGGLDGASATGTASFFENISAANVQGFDPNTAESGSDSYKSAINLLSNPDEYDVNMIWMPGLNAADHSVLTNKLITACETRGDCFAVIDPCLAKKDLGIPTGIASALDTSYAAMYWPWVQTSANNKFVWVPPSTLIPGIYAFNDKVAAEWYAPAGLNRGGLETVVQAERKLTHANRDTLYEDNVNPLATFPGEGVVVWGQKTLQKKASALDRVNVRRLLINLKKFIASTSKYLVFENNTAATRNRFLGSVNPYMEAVQQKQGLYAFKVVMDESNNTADLIDRNIMKGEIYLQPAKAAEFIVVDFNIMPTGATFED